MRNDRSSPAARGFAWWGPHDRARHSAALLLGGVATICAAYVAVVAIAVFVAIRVGQLGSHHAFSAWHHRLGPVRISLIVIALVVALGAVIAGLASEGLASRAIRWAGARPLADGEADQVRTCVEAFALGVGYPTPDIYVVDHQSPNGFAAGRKRACAVCLTTGALQLPPDQLDALCAQTIASVANRALPFTCAAADLVQIARWCTRAVWSVCGLLLVSTIFGVPPAFAAAVTVAIVLLVVLTLPMLMLADRAVPRLQAQSAELADLQAVSLTNQPAGLARLLLASVHDYGAVPSRWQIARLWFDSDTSRPAPSRTARRFQPWVEGYDPLDPPPAREIAARADRALIARARVVVDLTGDPTLRSALEQVAPVTGRRSSSRARSRASRRAAGG